MKELTGKAKEDFIEWLNYNYAWEDDVDNIFQSMPQSAQFGLIQEYADTLGIYIKASKSLSGYSYNVTRTLKHFQSFRSDTLQEAQREAVKQLSEILNK